jgi:hypothetical protein
MVSPIELKWKSIALAEQGMSRGLSTTNPNQEIFQDARMCLRATSLSGDACNSTTANILQQVKENKTNPLGPLMCLKSCHDQSNIDAEELGQFLSCLENTSLDVPILQRRYSLQIDV